MPLEHLKGDIEHAPFVIGKSPVLGAVNRLLVWELLCEIVCYKVIKEVFLIISNSCSLELLLHI